MLKHALIGGYGLTGLGLSSILCAPRQQGTGADGTTLRHPGGGTGGYPRPTQPTSEETR